MILFCHDRDRANCGGGRGSSSAPALGIALTGYFAYNLVEGDRGFIAWLRLTQQIRTRRTPISRRFAPSARRSSRRSSDLRPDHLDPDLLDERVRATLNLVAPNEPVIMRPPAHDAAPTPLATISGGDGPSSAPRSA